MVGMAEVGAPISLDGVAFHPDCWCICLCYVHFAPEIQKMAKCTFWYRLSRVVLDKVQGAVKWLCCVVCVSDGESRLDNSVKLLTTRTVKLM